MSKCNLALAMTDIAEDLILNAQMEPETEKRTLRKPVKQGLIAAAAAVLLVGSALATSGLWTPKLAELFGVKPEQQQALLKSGFVQTIGVSATDNGVTVTAEELIGDPYGVYILYSIRADEPDLLNAWTFPRYKLTLDGEPPKSGTRDWADTGNLFEVEQQRAEDGTLYFYDLLMVDGEEDLGGKEVRFQMDCIDDMAQVTDGPFPIIWQGEIDLSWTIEYIPSEVTLYPVHQAFFYHDTEVCIETVEVSSIGICMTCSGIPTEITSYENLGELVSAQEDYLALETALLHPVRVTMSDGTEWEMYRNDLGGTVRYEEDGTARLIALFAGEIFSKERHPVSICYEIDGETIVVALQA